MSELLSGDQTLRSAQINALERMLRFNNDPDAAGSGENSGTGTVTWKVLVFDTVGRDIISSVLRISDLFKSGVTLHVLLDAKRHPIPDVPAIYFVEPTAQNIDIIGRDVASGLYSSWSLNFTRPLSRELLEDLAAKTLNTSARINQVYEQFLQFNVLEPDVFSLELQNTYKLLSDAKTSEQDIEHRVAQIVDGIFCVLMTLGVVPVIRASRGNAAEMVAQLLDERLRSFLINKRGELPASMSKRRVALTLVDRNLDLVSMFSHSWTYQSLINDTCEFKRNAVRVPDGTVYDIEPTDSFWEGNQKLPFPEVADNLDAFVTKYKEEARKVTGSSDVEDPSKIDIAHTTTSLKTALTAVPELAQRKKAIDMHMNIATVLLKAIGDRGLAQLFEAEETASRQTPKSILELVRNPELGSFEDKLRLYLVYYITTHTPGRSVNPEELKPIEKELESLAEKESAGSESSKDQSVNELRALKYVKRTKEISRMSMAAASGQPGSATPTGASPDLFSRFAGSLSDRLNQGSSLSEGFGNLISGVRNFLPENKDLPVTKIAQQLLDPASATNSSSSGKVAEDFLYFDPHESRGSSTRPPPKRTFYDQAIVFMVGGGNFFEYANVATKFGSRVLFGATDIPTPHHFVEECAELGSQL